MNNMELEIREIKDKKIWEDFLLKCKEKTFLDSWNWGEFQKNMVSKIWRFGVYQQQQLFAVALIVKIEAKRGNFLFLPHGPSVALERKSGASVKYELLKSLSVRLKEIAKKEKIDFIRIAPIWEKTRENTQIFKELGFKTAPIHMHPELTWELDIALPEEELLMQMRKTTRYLIRKAQKNEEVKVISSQNLKDIERFNNLYQKTVLRHHFVPFSLDYLKNQFLAFSPDNQIAVFLGEYKKELVTSGVFLFWQDIGFYHHGASSLKHPKIPISYLLLWEAIREAKKRNCQKFNFWGIAPENRKNHPWQGLSLFKKGFGGYQKEYVETQDLPLSYKYWLNFLIEKLRKIKRGL